MASIATARDRSHDISSGPAGLRRRRRERPRRAARRRGAAGGEGLPHRVPLGTAQRCFRKPRGLPSGASRSGLRRGSKPRDRVQVDRGETRTDAELAEELVRLKVDVIMAPSSIYTEAAKRATSTIPIIFMSHADPLGTGHVKSLARPGGNATGLTIMMTETNVKGLELFKEAVPRLARVAVVWDPATPSHGPGLKAVEGAGPSLGLRIQSVPVRSASEYGSAFSAMVRERADGILVLSTRPVHRRRQASGGPRVDDTSCLRSSGRNITSRPVAS